MIVMGDRTLDLQDTRTGQALQLPSIFNAPVPPGDQERLAKLPWLKQLA